MEKLRIFAQLFFRPAFAMGEVMDRGSWVFAAGLMLVVSAVFFATINPRLERAYHIPTREEYFRSIEFSGDYDEDAAAVAARRAEAEYQSAVAARSPIPLIDRYFFLFFSFEPQAFFEPLLSLSLFYAPGIILLMSIFGGIGRFGSVLGRDYAVFATCSMMAWGAGHLPFAVAGAALAGSVAPPAVFLAMWFGSSVIFGLLMASAIRTVFGANYGLAILITAVSWIFLSLGTYVFRYVSPWLFSPFLLFFALMYFGGYLGGEIRGFGNAFRQRQNFKRSLQNATVNPRDADAHVQLALIYLQRRQDGRAIEHLRKAIEIDPEEIDANYELGKIARESGEFQAALDHFAVVAGQNDKHSLSEIWREIGATYMDAGMLEQARDALEKFVERRGYDTEGLYRLGVVLKLLGETERAGEMFKQAAEAARNSPGHRRRETMHWGKLAKKEL